MKTNGYKLREAIRDAELQRDTAIKLFDGSFDYFPGEAVKDPLKAMAVLQAAEERIVKLQTAQAIYNTSVTVMVGTRKMMLTTIIKALVGAGRIEKLWRTAAVPEKEERYGRTPAVRQADEIRAMRSMPLDAAMEEARKAQKASGNLRAALAEGNATMLDLDMLVEADFQ